MSEKNLKTKLLASTIISILSIGVVQTASAQQVGGETEAQNDEIIVTGSRIARNTTFDSAVPLDVVGKDAIEESGYTNAYDILKTVPAIGVGQGSANTAPAGLAGPEAGASFLNLRGLGVDRTLVLVNGRRRVSGSSSSAAVDISMIPGDLISSIETITGGSSAVYGADAVSGVVNFKLKEKLDGTEASIGGGLSTEGSGGERYNASLAHGFSFAQDRGQIVLGGTYSNENVLRADQRDFSRNHLALVGNPLNTSANDGIPDRVQVSPVHFTIVPYGGRFVAGGEAYTVDPGLRLLNGGTPFGGIRGLGEDIDGFTNADYTELRFEQEVFTLRGSANLELNEHVEAFASIDYGETETDIAGQPYNSFGIRTQRDNPLLPADIAQLMDANGLDFIAVNQVHDYIGERNIDSSRKSHTFLGGFKGDFSNGWNWDVAYQSGEYENSSIFNNFVDDARHRQAVDAILVDGQAVCRDAAARALGCVPVPGFGTAPLSDAARNFLVFAPERVHTNKQEILSASLTGELFTLPAGEVKFAAGVESRKEELESADTVTLTSRLFRTAAPQKAEQSVDEVYLETLIPIISGNQTLELEAAGRLSDYDTVGTTEAWKIGVNYAPIDDIRFRGSYSTSVRAPNLTELFSAGIAATAQILDPCDATRIDQGSATRVANCAALGIPVGYVDPDITARNAITGGNPDLQPETSKSFTIGAVLSPQSIPGLSFSVDYWDISIDDAVGSFGLTEVLNRCVDSPTINNPFCGQINRNAATNSVTSVELQQINVGNQSAKGIDFQGRYGFEAFDGDIDLVLNGTYLTELEQLVDAQDNDTLVLLRNDRNNPDLRANFNMSYSKGPWLARLNTRYIGSALVDANVRTDESIDRNKVKSKLYNDLVVGYTVNDNLDLTATVTNLLNVDPPFNDLTFNGTAGSYDNVGRFVSLRAGVKF